MRRKLLILLTALFCLLLTACGTADNTGTTDTASPSTAITGKTFLSVLSDNGLEAYALSQAIPEDYWETDSSLTGMSAYYGVIMIPDGTEGHAVDLYAMAFDYTDYPDEAETRRGNLTDQMAEDFDYLFSDVEDEFVIIVAGNGDYVETAQNIVTGLGYVIKS